MLSLEVFLLTYCFIALIKIMCDRREALNSLDGLPMEKRLQMIAEVISMS